jgi:hypothetical protein
MIVTRASRPVGSGPKRVLDVEDALAWAFREELPKRPPSGNIIAAGSPVSPMWRYGVFGARIDNWWREPGFPAALGDPHPDALEIEARVLALERLKGLAFDDPSGLLIGLEGFAPGRIRNDPWSPPLLDVGRITGEVSNMIVGLVAQHAKLRKRPEVDWEIPLPRWVLARFGPRPLVMRDVMVRNKADGALYPVQKPCTTYARRRGGRAYPIGAYCPLEWLPKPEAVLRDRAEYAVWRFALEALAHELAGKLESVTVLPPSAPAQPWAPKQEQQSPQNARVDVLQVPAGREVRRRS